MSDKGMNKKIDNDDWTLYDRFIYGGMGYGNFCLPTHLFRIIATVLFPPLGIIIKHLKLGSSFPYITWETIKNLLLNVDDILYSFILTAMFYIPGLIYSLSQIDCEN